MEQEVEPLVPASNDCLYYVYGQRVGEMEENAKRKAKMTAIKHLSISILKLNKLHVLLHFSLEKLHVNILWYVKNITCFLDQLFTFSIHLPAISPLFI